MYKYLTLALLLVGYAVERSFPSSGDLCNLHVDKHGANAGIGYEIEVDVVPET